MKAAKRRRKWDKRWRNESFDPPWRIDGVAVPVRRALEDGWLQAGMSLLDIGCGAGAIAAWLTQQGLDVLGVDFSRYAIERARNAHGAIARLAFETIDVCQPDSLGRQFDALLDRGCLHGIADDMRSAYVQNVAAWTTPGGRFLLLMHCRDTTIEARTADVRALLGAAFDLIDVQPTSMEGPSAPEPIPGVTFRLVRR